MKSGIQKCFGVLGMFVLLVTLWILKEEWEEELWWKQKRFLKKPKGPQLHFSSPM